MDEVLRNALQIDHPDSLFKKKDDTLIADETVPPAPLPYPPTEVPPSKSRLPTDILTH
jgi:hypothetical protein